MSWRRAAAALCAVALGLCGMAPGHFERGRLQRLFDESDTDRAVRLQADVNRRHALREARRPKNRLQRRAAASHARRKGKA
jgi:hypothetical protein